MIKAEGLRKRYGDVVAVDGVSFEVAPHETFGLLGPNGAGKTTTIHMLVGLIKPDAGVVHMDEVSDPTRPEARRSIGIAPQVLSLYDDLTARENLMFFGRLYGLHGRRLRERVAAVLERAALVEKVHALVKTLSGGMQRRLQLACALVHEPQVLLLDEPTVGIDPHARHHILQDIEHLRQQGCTILLTTHYMEEAQRLCDRVAIMDHGRILVMDSLKAILDRGGGVVVVRAELELPLPESIDLPGRIKGTSLAFETSQPLEAVQRLLKAGVSIQSLSIDRPNLETVFLDLTGRSLRD